MRRALPLLVAALAGACVLPDYQTVSGSGGSGGGGGSSPACDEPLTKSIGTPSTDEYAIDLVADGTDTVVIGGFNGTIAYVPGTTLTSNDFDTFVAKLGPDGAAAWVTQLTGVDGQYPQAIAQTSDGGFVVVGNFRGELATVDPPVAAGGGFDPYAVRIEPDGSIGWTVTFGGPNDDIVTDVAATPDGGVVLVGYFLDEMLIDGETLPGTVGDTLTETFVVKLDADGGFAEKLIFTQDGAASSGSAIAVLPNGGAYVAGNYTGRLGVTAPEAAPDADGLDAFVVKLDASMVPLWSRRYGGIGDQVVTNLVTAGDGFAFAGVTNGTLDELDFAGAKATPADDDPGVFVARVSDANVGAWLRVFNAAAIDTDPQPVVSALAVASDRILLGFTTREPMTFGPETLPADALGADPIVLALNPGTGALMATAAPSAPDAQRIEEILAGDCGVVFAGWFETELTMPDTPKVESTGRNVAVGRLGPTLVGP